MIDEFELFRARAYGLRDDSHVDRHRDDISEKSGDDVTSGSQRRMCHTVCHCFNKLPSWQVA